LFLTIWFMKKHTILFLAANPSGTDPRALDREARAIRVELERSGFRDCFELVTRWAAEPLDLLRELRKLQPTVVHFSGHGNGTPERDVQRHGLYFQGPDGRAQVVSTTALEKTFGAVRAPIKLIVLNACYTATQATALLAHVDCVVGMSGSLHEDAARNFAIGFYGGLGERESVAAAYNQGRAAISLEGLSDSEQPQLKVRDGVDANQLVLAGRSVAHSSAPDFAETPMTSPDVHAQLRLPLLAVVGSGVVLAAAGVSALLLTSGDRHAKVSNEGGGHLDASRQVDREHPDALSIPPDMVSIPGASFTMGTRSEDVDGVKKWCLAVAAPKDYCDERADAFSRQEPARHVTVTSFLLDRHEVDRTTLVGLFRRTGERIYVADEGVFGREGVLIAKVNPGTGIVWSPSSGFGIEGDGSLPAVRVTWEGARWICRERGLRLPTAVEWELAARGPHGRRFPWGDADPRCSNAVYGRTQKVTGWKPCPGVLAPVPVDGDPGMDRTPEGVDYLAGNVAEWVDGEGPEDPDCSSRLLRPLRGGSFTSLPDTLRGARARFLCGAEFAADLGVRCAR
jgi:formylglycine-generating enzyme required for sulfatase activity